MEDSPSLSRIAGNCSMAASGTSTFVDYSSCKQTGFGNRKRRSLEASVSAGFTAGSTGKLSAGLTAGSSAQCVPNDDHKEFRDEINARKTPALPSDGSIELIKSSLDASCPPGNFGRHLAREEWYSMDYHEKDLTNALVKDGRKRRNTDYTKQKKKKKRQEMWLTDVNQRFTSLTTKPKARARPDQ